MLFIKALGLAIAIEGLFYAAFPDMAKKLAVQLLTLAPDQLRFAGLAAAVFGVVLVWLTSFG
jgi:uncharacterized protein YjeT (DUF2065 family)